MEAAMTEPLYRLRRRSHKPLHLRLSPLSGFRAEPQSLLGNAVRSDPVQTRQRRRKDGIQSWRFLVLADSSMGSREEEFEPSALGTKEQFGEESMTRLIRWMENQKIPLDSSVLDIGTGNGTLLVELAKSGYTKLTGVDYSPSAIQLSKCIMEKEGLSHVRLQVEDILNPSDELSGFQICIDKGTFDAISLNPDNAAEKRKQYVKSLQRILRPNGFLLITSCNWTREELLNEFEEGFRLLEELPTPAFCFGGRTGNSVTALVFQQKI
ncbi:hypothetical protein lerEdw1_007773 [Lerista edwardsae]|nr:hypothetical protein lerEdw1_007773 [Lerista edwardsae]